MRMAQFKRFLAGGETLRVYHGNKLAFTSVRDRLLPWLDYFNRFDRRPLPPVVVFDKIAGNAAALLAVRAGCAEIYSPLGSQHAMKTLTEHGVRHHLGRVEPYIIRADGEGICPMEAMSLDKGPEEFYLRLVRIITPEAGVR